MIPYGRQEIMQADISAVVNVLRSDFLKQVPVVPRFEEALANREGAQHSVAVNSATPALHIACPALGLGLKDWRWTSAVTFWTEPQQNAVAVVFLNAPVGSDNPRA